MIKLVFAVLAVSPFLSSVCPGQSAQLAGVSQLRGYPQPEWWGTTGQCKGVLIVWKLYNGHAYVDKYGYRYRSFAKASQRLANGRWLRQLTYVPTGGDSPVGVVRIPEAQIPFKGSVTWKLSWTGSVLVPPTQELVYAIPVKVPRSLCGGAKSATSGVAVSGGGANVASGITSASLATTATAANLGLHVDYGPPLGVGVLVVSDSLLTNPLVAANGLLNVNLASGLVIPVSLDSMGRFSLTAPLPPSTAEIYVQGLFLGGPTNSMVTSSGYVRLPTR